MPPWRVQGQMHFYFTDSNLRRITTACCCAPQFITVFLYSFETLKTPSHAPALSTSGVSVKRFLVIQHLLYCCFTSLSHKYYCRPSLYDHFIFLLRTECSFRSSGETELIESYFETRETKINFIAQRNFILGLEFIEGWKGLQFLRVSG
jgi:hypothetical protein